MIPMLDNLLQRAGEAGCRSSCSHGPPRRLNVLVNLPWQDAEGLFSEFEGKHDDALLAASEVHQGFSSDINTPGGPMHLTLASSFASRDREPGGRGSVRARQHRRKDARASRCCRC